MQSFKSKSTGTLRFLLSIELILLIITIQNFIHRFKKIDYLQIQEYEILKYIPDVHSSCVRKRIVVK